jgi:hypothetical protein
VLAGSGQGPLSIAFHPRFATSRLFYVDYTARNGNTVIAEYRARAGHPVRTRVLVNLPDPAPNHNGGQLVLGPDGYLWSGNGDGCGGGDEYGNGQRAAGSFAKSTRLAIDRRPARWSTRAVRLRNPWRFSFDRVTGALHVGDVGQSECEEIDTHRRARRSSTLAGTATRGNEPYGSDELLAGWTLPAPVHVYDHGSGCSVTGGYVYRGAAAPAAAAPR